ncbi:MAG: c-type cytochrome [Woeseiaceae bacterium]
MNRDQKFFDMYSLVIGVLLIIALLIYVGVAKLSDITQGVYTADSEEYQAAVADRLRPFGQVYMPGEEESAGEPVVAEAAQPDPVETMMSGPQVYNDACLVCHGAGLGGAPVLGDTETWESRLAQGNDTLYLHAIEGFTGEAGFMPAKGARVDLTDDEVRAAVDYMIGEVGN